MSTLPGAPVPAPLLNFPQEIEKRVSLGQIRWAAPLLFAYLSNIANDWAGQAYTHSERVCSPVTLLGVLPCSGDIGWP